MVNSGHVVSRHVGLLCLLLSASLAAQTGTVSTPAGTTDSPSISVNLDLDLDLDLEFRTHIEPGANTQIESDSPTGEALRTVTPFTLSLALPALERIRQQGLNELALNLLEVLPLADGESSEARQQVRWQLLEAQGHWETLKAEISSAFISAKGELRLQIGIKLGDLLQRRGDASKALSVYLALLSEDRLDDTIVQQIRYRIVQTYQQQGRFEDAEVAARSYETEFSPESESWQLLRARIALARGQPEQAASVLWKAKTPEARLWRSYALWQSGAEAVELALIQLGSVSIPADDAVLASTRQAMLVQVASSPRYAELRARAVEDLIASDVAVDPLVHVNGEAVLIEAYQEFARKILHTRGLSEQTADEVWEMLIQSTDLGATEERALCIYLLQQGLAPRHQVAAYAWLVRRLLEEERGALVNLLFGQNGQLGRYADLDDESLLLLVDQALADSDFPGAARMQALINQPVAGVNPGAWVLRSARLQVLGGNAQAGATELELWLSRLHSIAPASLDQVMQVMFDLQFLGEHQLALDLFAAAAPLVQSPDHKRELVYWVAQSWIELGDFVRGAAYFIESANLSGAQDALWAQSALYRAAQALESAGLFDDASTVYHRLLNDTSDPKLQAKLRYRLAQIQLGRLRIE